MSAFYLAWSVLFIGINNVQPLVLRLLSHWVMFYIVNLHFGLQESLFQMFGVLYFKYQGLENMRSKTKKT